MSFFTKIFGGKKDDEGPTPSQAIQKLRETEDMLMKKQEFLEKKIELEITVARKNASSNKRGMKYMCLIKHQLLTNVSLCSCYPGS